MFMNPFSEPSYLVDEGMLILEEIRIETFHHRINLINQKNFVMICSDSSLYVNPDYGSKSFFRE